MLPDTTRLLPKVLDPVDRLQCLYIDRVKELLAVQQTNLHV